MTSSNGNILRVTGPLRGEIPLTKGQWRRALMVSSICTWTNCWVNSRDTCDLRRHRANYAVTVLQFDHGSKMMYK